MRVKTQGKKPLNTQFVLLVVFFSTFFSVGFFIMYLFSPVCTTVLCGTDSYEELMQGIHRDCTVCKSRFEMLLGAK